MGKNNPRLCALVLVPREAYSRKQQHMQFLARGHPETLDAFVAECLRFTHPELKKQRTVVLFFFGWEHSFDVNQLVEQEKRLLRWEGTGYSSLESFYRTHLAPFFVSTEAA